MLIKQLGLSKINMPALGMGMDYDLPIVKMEREKIKRIIRGGLDLGLKLVDSAEGYADGDIETLLGEVIKQINRGSIFVATKFSPKNSSFEGVVKAAENSLKRLGTDFIDLYQFHWPNPKIEIRETLEALDKLHRDGKILHVGLGNFSGKDIKTAMELGAGLSIKIVSLQTEFNLFERSVEQNGTLEYCNGAGISLIAFSPLDQGRISEIPQKQARPFYTLAKKYEATAAQMILAWLISKNEVFAIPKTLSTRHLKENVAALALKISKEDLEKIDEVFEMKIVEIPVQEICVSTEGENRKAVYQTAEEALENKLNFTPSPSDLAVSLIQGGFLKPVRVAARKNPGKIKFDLMGGRTRYWAWVLAFNGKKPIPACIREEDSD